MAGCMTLQNQSYRVLLADFSEMLSAWLIFPSLFISACHKSWISPDSSEHRLHPAETNKGKRVERNACLLFIVFLFVWIKALSCDVTWRDVCGVGLSCVGWHVCVNHDLTYRWTEEGQRRDGGGMSGGGHTAAKTRLWAARKQINGFNLDVETFSRENNRWHLRPCHMSLQSRLRPRDIYLNLNMSNRGGSEAHVCTGKLEIRK